MIGTFSTIFSKYLSKLLSLTWVGSETFLLSLKTADTSHNGVCFYLYRCILFTFLTVQFMSDYPMNNIKLLPYIYSSSMVSFIYVDSFQASISNMYNTNMQVQKKYNIHNKIPVNPSAKLTQTMCVNPYIV